MNKLKLQLILPLMILAMLSCKKDEVKDPNEATNDKISANIWSVRSFTSDGVELMDVLLNSMDLRFTKEDKTNGTARWTLISTLGQTTRIEGKYNVRNSGKEIDFDGDIFEVTVDNTKLLLTGRVDGEKWVIDARK
ncbi:MAG: hypothetical protein IPM26_05810 [Saprospiraceae bacterium]|nr:hypothetical protein [Saprospiraceae bacterium]